MQQRICHLAVGLFAAALLTGSGASASAADGDGWLARKPTTPLWIVTPDARCLRYRVWVVSTPEEFSRGLMFVRTLPEATGMLFALGREREMSMWMRNTLIPLDMFFADSSGLIVSIHENAEPLSLTQIHSGQPVLAVLELGGGAAKQHGIHPGDQLRHSHFGTSGCQEGRHSAATGNKD